MTHPRNRQDTGQSTGRVLPLARPAVDAPVHLPADLIEELACLLGDALVEEWRIRNQTPRSGFNDTDAAPLTPADPLEAPQ
jgi:hypothetical protein